MKRAETFESFLDQTVGREVRRSQRGEVWSTTLLLMVALWLGGLLLVSQVPDAGAALAGCAEQIRLSSLETLASWELASAAAANGLDTAAVVGLAVVALAAPAWCLALFGRWLRGASTHLGRAYQRYLLSPRDQASRLVLGEHLRQSFYFLYTPEVSVDPYWSREDADDMLLGANPQEDGEGAPTPPMKLLLKSKQRVSEFTRGTLRPRRMPVAAPLLLVGLIAAVMAIGLPAPVFSVTAPEEESSKTEDAPPEPQAPRTTEPKDPTTVTVFEQALHDWEVLGGSIDEGALESNERTFDLPEGMKEVVTQLTNSGKPEAKALADLVKKAPRMKSNDPETTKNLKETLEEARRIEKQKMSDKEARAGIDNGKAMIEEGKRLQKEAAEHDREAARKEAEATEALKAKKEAEEEVRRAQAAMTAARTQALRLAAQLQMKEANQTMLLAGANLRKAQQKALLAGANLRKAQEAAKKHLSAGRKKRRGGALLVVKGAVTAAAFAANPALGVATTVYLFTGGGNGPGGDGNGGKGGTGTGGGSGSGTGPGNATTSNSTNPGEHKDSKPNGDKPGEKKPPKDKPDTTKPDATNPGQPPAGNSPRPTLPPPQQTPGGKPDQLPAGNGPNPPKKEPGDKPGTKLGGLPGGPDVEVAAVSGNKVEVKAGSQRTTVAVLDAGAFANSQLTRVFADSENPGVLFTGRGGALEIANAAGAVRDSGLNLKDLGTLPAGAAGLDRARELILSLTMRQPSPRLLCKDKIDNKDYWVFHESATDTLVWVLDEGEKSRILERKLDKGFVPPSAQRDKLPNDLAGFFAALAGVTPKLPVDALELTRQLPALRRPADELRAVVVLYEGEDPRRKAVLQVYDPAKKALVLRGSMSRMSYDSLLNRSGNLHATGEKVLFERLLDDSAGAPTTALGWQKEGWLLAAIYCDQRDKVSAVLTRTKSGADLVRYLPLEAANRDGWRENSLAEIEKLYADLRKLNVYKRMPGKLSTKPLERAFDSWTGQKDEALKRDFPVWIQDRTEVLPLFPGE